MSTKDPKKDLRLYETPSYVLDMIMDEIPLFGPSADPLILEPCAGRGAIVKRLIECGHDPENIYAVEPIVFRHAKIPLPEGNKFRGMIERYIPPVAGFDLIITNPSFDLFVTVAETCYPMLRGGGVLVLLNRLSVISTAKRKHFWQEHYSDVYVLPTRPSFVKSGRRDTWDYAFVIVHQGRGPDEDDFLGRWKLLRG